MDGFLLEVDVAEVEPYGLRGTKTRRVDELDQRPVAKRQRPVAVEPSSIDSISARRRRVRKPAAPAQAE